MNDQNESILKSYQDRLINDYRECYGKWSRPIGPHYRDKKWEELTPDEMKADFDWKNDLLASYGEQVSPSTFYENLFSNLIDRPDEMFFEKSKKDKQGNVIETKKQEYKLVLNKYDDKSKVKKIDLDQIEEYFDYNDVAISPCLFFGNYRRKRLLNYVGAFVLDIDKVRPKDMSLFLELFAEKKMLVPTYVVNSGSGVHFYYVLDQMFRCDVGSYEANNRIATIVYNGLYEDIKSVGYPNGQKHWIGQDYRVVGSKTKLNQTCSAFETGNLYTIQYLIDYFRININQTTHYASHDMMKYAKSIAKDLELELPDFNNSKETYQFIADHKDAAYQVREARRKRREESEKKQKKKSKKKLMWYRNTIEYIKRWTMIGNRFNCLKALAVIAYKQEVPFDIFERDLKEIVEFWNTTRREKDRKWEQDRFNEKNLEAIIRLFEHCEPYHNTSAETLEEWLGTNFKKIGVKRNGRKQEVHLKIARATRDIINENWRDGNGVKPKKDIVQEWQKANPNGKKADCIKETGLTKPTVYRWWTATANCQEVVHYWRRMNPDGTKYRCIKETGLDKKTVSKWWNCTDLEEK